MRTPQRGVLCDARAGQSAYVPLGIPNSMQPSGAAMEFTILMPCLDEALTVETCVRKAGEYLKKRGISGEILVADNGSTDGSPPLAGPAGARARQGEVEGMR